MATQMSPQETPSSALSGRLIVMPDAYVPKEKKKLSSTAILAIVLGIVALLVIIVLVLFFTRTPQTTPVAQAPIEQTPVIEQPAQQQPQQPAQPATPQPVQEQPVATPRVQLPAVISGVLPVAVDTDQDSLTDIEEQLFLTSASVPDTDQDSFLDGVELRNLYDPATPRALLEVSPQIKIARNESLGYQLLVPLAWTATRSTADGREFIVRPDQGSESFRIMVYDNEARLSVTEWLQQQDPSVNLTQYVNFRNESSWIGVQTQDHTLVIASFDDGGPGSRALMFVMHYDAGQETSLRFPAVWDTMTNSLSVSSGDTAATQ